MTPVLELREVSQEFKVAQGLFAASRTLHAVRNVSLSVDKGEVLGLVGESGCGKSTIAKILLGLLKPTHGSVLIDGVAVESIPRLERVRRMQPVFQDPYSALNPTRTVRALVEQPLRMHRLDTGKGGAVALDMLERVGFPKRLANAYPAELSGGQRQRVAIARALVLRPQVLVCDEPTSALDVSVQAQVINLLLSLRRDLNLTMLFVSHNLAVVEHLADRVAVMYLGKVVELSNALQMFRQPVHPYTQALFASTLVPRPGVGLPTPRLGAAAADALAQSPGCALAPRCPMALDLCRAEAPELRILDHTHVRCHRAEESRASG